jgi:hypothetical protein
MAGYLPIGFLALVDWGKNFAEKIKNKFQSTLSVTDAEITEIETKTIKLADLNTAVATTEKQLADLRLDQKNAKADLTSDIASLVKRIRTRKELTEAIAEELDIIPTTTSIDFNSLKPEIKVTLVANIPQYEYTKKGTTGISVYCKRGSDTNFVFIDKDFKTPYVDKRPNLEPGTPEIRSYKFRYFYDDKEVGNWSDEISVTVNN